VADKELDVRALPTPDRHAAILQTYEALSVGESFVLVTDHDPHHLRNEFDTDHPDSHGWEYLDQGPGTWRIQISKLATTPLPRVVCDTMTIIHHSQPEAGVAWKLPMNRRDLDSNIIRLAPGASIGAHVGPDLDVLLLVLDGTGHLTTEIHTIDLHPGALIWLPQHSRRQFTAGPHGLSYLTVHQRRQSLILNPPPHRH
jgi:uncharacterized protein (DUF2249 family)/quercetin dioxygenase-like cupin family protein